MSPLDRSRAAGYGLRMISHTDACKVYRDLGQAHLNFVVLSCHAVPALKAELSVPGGAATVPPDHFKAGSNTASELLSYADDYHEELARSALITVFSYFEAYVKDALTEIVDFRDRKSTRLNSSH